MKTCFKCGATKDFSEFYAHKMMADGHLGKCKECTKADVAKRYALKHDMVMAYEKKRQAYPERLAAQRGYSANYRKKFPEKRTETLKRHNEKYPEKYAARVTAKNRVRDGKLVRLPCVVCGSEKSEGHHEDYSKPLEVTWLCRKHHAARHVEMRSSLKPNNL